MLDKRIFPRLVKLNSVYLLFGAGAILKVTSDVLVYHDSFGTPGALLTICAIAAFILCAAGSLKASILLSLASFINGAVCYRLGLKLLDHGDVFGADAWIVVGVWIWFAGGILCLLVGITRALLKKRLH